MANTAMDVKKFFDPIDSGEFMEFWKGLTDEEKAAFKEADLS